MDVFCYFLLTSAKYICMYEQFLTVHLKDLIEYFQKMIWFIGLGSAILEILHEEVRKNIQKYADTAKI